jgi:hypothetical protein
VRDWVHRRLLDGGRWNPCSSEHAVWPGQQARLQALVVLGERLGSLNQCRLERAGRFTEECQWRAAAGSGSREEEVGRLFIGKQGGGGVSLRAKAVGSQYGARHGWWGQRRRAATPWPMAGGGAPASVWELDAWHRPRLGARHPYIATVPAARASDRRSVRGLSVHAYGGWGRRAATMSRAWARTSPIWNSLSPVQARFSQNFWTEWTNIWIPKLFTTLPSISLPKALGRFSQPILHKLHAKIIDFWAPMNSNKGVDLHFSPFCTSNQQWHSTWKLCPLTNYTTFTLGDFEVFRWILDNAAKVSGDIGGSKGVLGFWLGFWPNLSKGWPRLTKVGH